jgi:hypothetical protein
MAGLCTLTTTERSNRLKFGGILLWAFLISSLYLPTLTTPFDFIDDGNLVYPSHVSSLSQRIDLLSQKIYANYHDLGPFRPVLWAHWELEANVLGANAHRWRAARFLWTVLASSAMLWLLTELEIRSAAAILTTAIAMWSPHRSEVWTSLTLAEGVAMPYALVALVCAVRAPRSPRPWAWDLSSAVCLLMALGCKNTFAAIVPAQLALRLVADGSTLRQGWRLHGKRVSMLAGTLLLPVVHYVIFRLNWHSGQYQTSVPSFVQLLRMLEDLKGALGLDYLAPGFAILIIALVVNDLKDRSRTDDNRRRSVMPAARRVFGIVIRRYWPACLAGFLLLIFGLGIYLPMSAASGRYTMPAIWGVDLLVAAVLSVFLEVGGGSWKRAGYIALAGGLAAMAIGNIGRQEKFAARAQVLWQALEYVESRAQSKAPREACIGWVARPGLGVEEGIHFYWHVTHRGRQDLLFRILDSRGGPIVREEIPPTEVPPGVLVKGSPIPASTEWKPAQDFKEYYWVGRRAFSCYVALRQPGERRAMQPLAESHRQTR